MNDEKEQKLDELFNELDELNEQFKEDDTTDEQILEENYQKFLNGDFDPYIYVTKYKNKKIPTFDDIKKLLNEFKINISDYNYLCESFNYDILSENEINEYLNNIDSYQMLLNAISINNLNYVKLAIENGANMRYDNDLPFRNCSIHGNVEILKYLYENGADIHVLNDYPIKYAALFNRTENIKFLNEHGADINIDNDIVLFNACQYDNIELVKYLVEHGSIIHKYYIRLFSNKKNIIKYIEENYKE